MDVEESPWADSASEPPSQTSDPASSSQPSQQPSGKSSSTTKQLSAGGGGGTARAARATTPRRLVAQATRLESSDDPLGPLGGTSSDTDTDRAGGIKSPLSGGGILGEATPPVPPLKEGTSSSSPGGAMRTTMAGGGPMTRATTTNTTNITATLRRKPSDPHAIDDEDEAAGGDDDAGGRVPPPVQVASPTVRSGMAPSMSVEEAAKPSFYITVGDPHKVGDLTSSHIVYSVRTKTTSKAYKRSEFEVKRRYRDFLWLYTTMHGNNPGVVVPPPPDKQAVGRFDTGFVEHRRAALEKMVNKVAAHPTLQRDADLKLFLESESFNVDVKHKERREPIPGESKGVLGSLGINVGGGNKFVEQDDWFHERKVYLDALENQLKALLKAMETMVSQRKGMAEAAGDFSSALHALSTVELAATLSGPLDALSALQEAVRDVYDRQAQQDELTLGIVIEEYLRLIGSAKKALEQRQRAFHAWHAAESELARRRHAQDKLLRQGRSQTDRLHAASRDVDEAERKVQHARGLFEEMGKLMRTELERFEKEKVEDFKSGVETFLESAVEAQKELIEKWETFLVQLDAEDDESVFYRPPVFQPSNKPAGDTAIDRARATINDDSD